MASTLSTHAHKRRSPVSRRPKETAGWVVRACTRGTAGNRLAADLTPSKLVAALQAGLPFTELEDLRSSLGVSMEKLAGILGIAKATLHRRKGTGRLGPGESDRVVRFARLLGKAVEVLEAEEIARKWLTSPQVGLGGAVPLNFAATEVGGREVEDLLGRIEHGVYS